MFFGLISIMIYAQEENCFLKDFELKSPIYPPSETEVKTTESPTVIVNIDRKNAQHKISKYIFGNALAVWVGNDIYNNTFMSHLEKLAPTLIRFPGGSWSNIFFWDGKPEFVPDQIFTGDGQSLSPQLGAGSWPTTTDTYYDMRWDVDTEGLITINYAYARYGTADDPVAQAAHYAAEWVRYDDGRTKFWEIGNENAGPWEAGWKIDTTLNKDGQPEIISGELYGKHFLVFADSMRAAAEELGNEIFIGGQIIHFDASNAWNEPDKKWNEGFFREVGDAADFYVVHNYFGNSINSSDLLNAGTKTPREMMEFITTDIAAKGAAPKPIALTEWNIQGLAGYETAKRSIINGMQAVIVFCELARLNYGMSARWLLVTDEDAMFYDGSDSSIPAYSPRPEFFYIYYLQHFLGDHLINASTDNADVLAYATTFGTGEWGLILINKSKSEQVINVNLDQPVSGENYYIYSLKGGTDHPSLSQYVYVNDVVPTENYWGPIENLEDIPAWSYPIDGGIKFNSPARSVQFILIESDPLVSVNDQKEISFANNSSSLRVYPSPASNMFKLNLPNENYSKMEIVDILGRTVYTQNIMSLMGTMEVKPNLASGLYFIRVFNQHEIKTTKLIIRK